nr:MAG TPA: hypothetical protein [Caudoviricetes sp.]
MKSNGCGCLIIMLVLLAFAPQLFVLLALVLSVMALLKYLLN